MSTPLFPSEWSKIWIRGTFINLDGTPMTGQVSFAANVTGKTMVASAAKKLIGAKGLSVALDGSGYFQLQIPATNDPDITPLNFTYTVSEPTGRTYPITVPWNTPALSAPSDPLNGQQVIDLTDIVPSPGASGGVGQLLRGIGIQSTTVDGNGHLLVTYTDGRTEDAGFIGSGGSGTVPDATTTVKGKQVLLGGTADAPTVPYGKVTGAPTALPPSGGAGGVLSGNYPDPAFAVDMATQAELDAVSSATQSALDGLPFRANNTTTTGAAVGKVVAVAAVDGQGKVTGWNLITPGGGGGGAVSSVAGRTGDVVIGWADLSGLLPTSKLPPLGITDVFPVANQAARLALTAQRGDIAVQASPAPAKTYALATDDPTQDANWVLLPAIGSVQTVNGQQGAVVLAASDVGAVPVSLVDAKGDQLVGSANDTLVRVPVGADGRVWTADSNAPAGMSWQPPGGGSTVITNWTANTAYVAGQPVVYQGVLYRAKTGFTSGTTFSAANWDAIGPSAGEVVYVYNGSAYELAPGNVDNGTSPRFFIGSVNPATISGYAARTGDVWIPPGDFPTRTEMQAAVAAVTASGLADSWMGYAVTTDVPGGNAAIGGANRGYFQRVTRGSVASASKIGIHIGTTSAGTLCLAVYRNTGSGLAARPGTRVATTGAVACPAAGYAELALDTPVQVAAGDWIGLSVSDTTIAAHAYIGNLASPLYGPITGYADNVHPLPATAPALTAFGRVFNLVAVP